MSFDEPHSHGLWARSAPTAPHVQPLRGVRRAQVAIVGGGFTGLSAALHLAEQGVDCVLVEAHDIGYGGSGRNVGLVNAGLWLKPDDVLEALPAPFGERLVALLSDGPSVVFTLIERHSIECEAERSGTLHCAVGRAGLAEIEERARQWQARGAPVDLLDRAAAKRATGSDAFTGVLLDRRAGTIQPLAYARGLARAAMAAGATLHCASPVRQTRHENGLWQLCVPDGQVSAERLLVATNAYTADGCFPELARELIRLPYFNMATAPLTRQQRAAVLPAGIGGWDTRDILSSFRLDRAGRLVFGSVGSLAGVGHSIHSAWGRRAMARIFPALEGVAFETQWYGQIGMTADSVPRFHQPAPGVLSFSGFNGRGIAPGTVFGRLAAQVLAGTLAPEEMPLPQSAIRPVRWRALREAGYRYGAELAHAAGARLR